MVKFRGMMIQLKRKDETITFAPDDYKEAAFGNDADINGSPLFLLVKGNDEIGQYYPLGYYEVTITGKRRGV